LSGNIQSVCHNDAEVTLFFLEKCSNNYFEKFGDKTKNFQFITLFIVVRIILTNVYFRIHYDVLLPIFQELIIYLNIIDEK